MTVRTTSRRVGRSGFRCTDCGWAAVKWAGRCGGCGSWGTVAEHLPPSSRLEPGGLVSAPVQIAEVDLSTTHRRGSGLAELDRVLGGGLVPGEVVLVAGEPGVGKSTMLLAAAAACARGGARVLYISAEESCAQVRLRAQRIDAVADGLLLAAETDLAAVLAHVGMSQPDLLVVDSVQTVSSVSVEGAAGNVAQVREVATGLIHDAKARGMATLLVGHVTKDGSVAGPRALEHLVDAVLLVEGDRHGPLRLLRAVKNRFGPTDEVGCLELGETGVSDLEDPSGLFLSSRDRPVPGTCVTVTLEGRRPLVTEIQALLAPTPSPTPRRTTSGIDSTRVSMLLAVLDRHAGLRMRYADCYVSTVGGVRVGEPSVDLAVVLAVTGSVRGAALPAGLVAIGEVGLAGELRPVSGLSRRLAEAARLGFAVALVPAVSWQDGAVDVGGMRVMPIRDVGEAVAVLPPPADRPLHESRARSPGRSNGQTRPLASVSRLRQVGGGQNQTRSRPKQGRDQPR